MRPEAPPRASETVQPQPLLEVRDLKTHFPLRGTFLDRLLGRDTGSVKAVDGVSFQVHRGEVLGLVGESGSGKTTLGRTLLRLVDPTEGSIAFNGQDLTRLGEPPMRSYRRRMQIVFQDPHASLNPAMDILAAVGHPLKIHGIARDPQGIRVRVAEALNRVGLVPVDQFMTKYPGELSGGQKQRAVLARAIILGPDLLVADEPVSMLDMSVRAKILELMLRLKEELDLTYLYITHDLATAKFFCDRIAIMYLGRIVEIGPSAAIYEDPKHPYTQALLRAIPEPDPTRSVPRDIPRGEVPDAVNPPLGCPFHPRCPKAFEACGWESRDLRELLERHWAGMSEDEYEAERARVGSLDELDQAAHLARVPAGSGGGHALLEMLEEVRAADPAEPFWTGVRSMTADESSVNVEFHDGREPRLLPADRVQVSCHLYDPEIREKAAPAPQSGKANTPGKIE